MNYQRGNGIIVFIIIIAIIWAIYSLIFNKYENGSSSSNRSSLSTKNICKEPENPYSSGSGHYAGYKWGESGKTCGGNSGSFIEGCEEYQTQNEVYIQCTNN